MLRVKIKYNPYKERWVMRHARTDGAMEEFWDCDHIKKWFKHLNIDENCEYIFDLLDPVLIEKIPIKKEKL